MNNQRLMVLTLASFGCRIMSILIYPINDMEEEQVRIRDRGPESRWPL